MSDAEHEIRGLYRHIHESWNAQSGTGFAEPFVEEGKVIGYDGSVHDGREEIARELDTIFGDHETARYVGKVKTVQPLGEDGAVLYAIAGMVPPGSDTINPKVNSHQTLTAFRGPDRAWRIVLFQNTPAQFHGREDLAAAMTEELQMELERRASS